MHDEDELLEQDRPLLPRRLRLAALAAAVLAVAALVVARTRPHPAPHHPAAPPPPTTSGPSALTAQQPWPTAPDACGGSTEVPIVSSAPPAERTGLRLLIGGARLRTVDFDRGTVRPVGGPGLRPHEFVTGLSGGTPPYALTGVCTGVGDMRAIEIGTGGRATPVALPGSVATVFADGTHSWAAAFPDDFHARGYLEPVGGGRRVWLPQRFTPTAITDGIAFGSLPTAGRAPGELLLVDAATGAVRGRLGRGFALAGGSGVAVWTAGCLLDDVRRPCVLHSRAVRGGPTSRYLIPSPPAYTAATISPDGRLLAFTVARGVLDVRYGFGHPLPPTEIAILHLDHGWLQIVPGVEIPAKVSPGLAFSPDSHWLVAALDAGARTRLLAWRPVLGRPYEAARIPGRTWGRTPVAVLS